MSDRPKRPNKPARADSPRVKPAPAIEVIGSSDADTARRAYVPKDYKGRPLPLSLKKFQVSVEELGTQVSEFVQCFGAALDAIPTANGQFDVSSVELSVEISAGGKLSVFGSGLDVGSKGGMKIKFERIQK